MNICNTGLPESPSQKNKKTEGTLKANDSNILSRFIPRGACKESGSVGLVNPEVIADPVKNNEHLLFSSIIHLDMVSPAACW
jgi:hypothetical protein